MFWKLFRIFISAVYCPPYEYQQTLTHFIVFICMWDVGCVEMADTSRKRSRKSKLVPRECFLYEDDLELQVGKPPF